MGACFSGIRAYQNALYMLCTRSQFRRKSLNGHHWPRCRRGPRLSPCLTRPEK